MWIYIQLELEKKIHPVLQGKERLYISFYSFYAHLSLMNAYAKNGQVAVRAKGVNE